MAKGNPICSLETLHQGNSRQRGSCKDDIDRFEIPLFPLLDIGALRLPQISSPGTVSCRAPSFDHNQQKVICWIYLCFKDFRVWDTSVYNMWGSYRAEPGSVIPGREIHVYINLLRVLISTLKRAWRLIRSVNRCIKSGRTCRRFYDLITRSSLWHNTLSREC